MAHISKEEKKTLQNLFKIIQKCTPEQAAYVLGFAKCLEMTNLLVKPNEEK